MTGRICWTMALLLAVSPLAAPEGAERVSPEFSLTREELKAMTAGLPAGIREVILSRPADFLHQVGAVLDQPEDLFVLVDKQHSLAPTYVPPDLVPLKDYPLKLSWPGLKLRKAIMPAVLEMARAARADGVTLSFSSAYRSYDYQEGVFQREVDMYGRLAAERESAQAGHSQHQLGTAVDFGTISDDFAGTPEGRWVAAHAWEHGFSLSYPEGLESVTGYRHESWHYRYISRPGTLLQRSFFSDVQQYLLEFLAASRAALERRRLKPSRP